MKFATLGSAALLAGLLVAGCQQATVGSFSDYSKNGTPVQRTAVYHFYDANTKAKVDLSTADAVTIQYKATGGDTVTLTSSKSAYGKLDTVNDQVLVYNFENNEPFSLTLTKTGYKAFEGRSKFNLASKQTITTAAQKLEYTDKQNSNVDVIFFESVLVPSTVTNSTPAYTITVRDAVTKAAVTTGSFLLEMGSGYTLTAGNSPQVANTYGTTLPLNHYAPPVIASVASPSVGGYYAQSGSLSAGTISITAGTLFSGQSYTLKVYGASTGTTYYNDNSSLTFTANSQATAGALVVDLTKQFTSLSETASIKLLTTNNLDANNASGNVVKNVRAITLTFQFAVDVYTQGIMATRLSSLLSAFTSNTDGDADGTTLGTTALPTAGNLPTGLTVTGSGTTAITITVAATDAELTTGAVTPGTLDTGDALTWNLTPLFNSLKVKASADTAGTYTGSTTYTLTQVLDGTLTGGNPNGLPTSKVSSIVVR